MAEKKKKLNKGLDAIFGGDITSLIDDIEHNTPESSQEKIKLDEIRPNPYQPRKVFDEQALNELALSIQEHGDRKSTRLNSSHIEESRMPSSA